MSRTAVLALLFAIVGCSNESTQKAAEQPVLPRTLGERVATSPPVDLPDGGRLTLIRIKDATMPDEPLFERNCLLYTNDQLPAADLECLADSLEVGDEAQHPDEAERRYR